MIDLRTTTKQWLNVVEVMELLDVPRSTIYYWVAQRKVESLVIGSTVRISVSDLRRRLRAVDTASRAPRQLFPVQSVQHTSH